MVSKFNTFRNKLFFQFIKDFSIALREKTNFISKKELELAISLGISEEYFIETEKIHFLIFQGVKDQKIENLDELYLFEINKYINSQFPELKKIEYLLIETYTKNFVKLFERLEKSKKTLLENWSIDISLLSSVKFGLGDKHRGGKTVAQLDFKKRRRFIIYKPRNLSIDKHFNIFLHEIGTEIGYSFKTLEIISSSNEYGFVEFIDNKSCSSKIEIVEYYEKLGVILCLLYVMEATDFHYENIIAYGSNPILIDLESFFHPYIPIQGTETNQGLDKSVLRTGILSAKIKINNSSIDISGLSEVSGQESLFESQRLKVSKGNNITLNREKGILLGGKNIPILKDKRINGSWIYSKNIQTGFRKMYLHILKNKSNFKNAVSVFKNDEVRVLFRHTAVYTHLLEESNHPSLLKNRHLREKHFEWLKRVLPDYKVLERLVKLEIIDLLKRDIPLFSTRVNSKDLWYSDRKKLSNFFNQTGLNTVFDKIDSLTDKDMNNQLWIIDASLKIKKETSSNKKNISNTKPVSYSNTPLRKVLKENVSSVCAFILNNININKDSVNWLIIKPDNLESSEVSISVPLYDLFSGLPGEILFLSYVKDNDKNSKLIAEKAYNQLIKHITTSKDSIKPIGLYVGWGSVIYLNAILWNLTKESKYKENTNTLFNEIDFQNLIKLDENFSLLKGSAGFIVACLKYYNLTSDTQSLFLAEEAANHLINHQTKTEIGMGWKIASKVPLSGLAHSFSGFMLAFALLYKATKKEKYKELVYKCLDYENSLFSPKNKNWLDKRDFIMKKFQGQEFCSTAWSHGAGGIGLTRLELIKLGLDDAFIKKDLETSVQAVLKNNFGNLHSLTYGDFGNLELLHQYSKVFNDDEVYKQWNKITSALLNDINQNGWKLSLKKVNSLGLMSGVTGIGYQCLRFLQPDKVPSVLMPT